MLTDPVAGEKGHGATYSVWRTDDLSNGTVRAVSLFWRCPLVGATAPEIIGIKDGAPKREIREECLQFLVTLKYLIRVQRNAWQFVLSHAHAAGRGWKKGIETLDQKIVKEG